MFSLGTQLVFSGIIFNITFDYNDRLNWCLVEQVTFSVLPDVALILQPSENLPKLTEQLQN